MFLLEAAQAKTGYSYEWLSRGLGGRGSWDGISGPRCPLCQLVVEQNPAPAPTCPPRPQPVPYLVVLGPHPRPEPPTGVIGAPCLTGLWVSLWDEARRPPRLGAWEKPLGPWPSAQPLPAPPLPTTVCLLRASHSGCLGLLFFCKCHLYN